MDWTQEPTRSLIWLLTVMGITCSEATQLPAPPTGTIWQSRWTVQRSSNCGGEPSASQEALTPGTSTTKCGECRWIPRATTCSWEDPETSIPTVQNLEAGPATSGSPTLWWSARTGTNYTRASMAPRLGMKLGSTSPSPAPATL